MDYLRRWRELPRAAWLYLTHAALLTGSLAVTSLLFNLAILALGYPRSFIGLLTTLGVGSAAVLSLPLWWLAGRVGPRRALLVSAGLQAAGALAVAIWPAAPLLLIATIGTGMAAVLFQVAAAPLMMRQSDDATRDHLFSANAAVNLGVAGLGSLAAGYLPALAALALGVAPESGLSYRVAFGVAGLGLALSLVPLLLIRDDRRTANDGPEAGPPRPVSNPGEHAPHASDEPAAGRWRSVVIPEPWRSMLRRPWPIVQLVAPPALISFGAALLIPYLNLFFKERFGVPDSSLGAIFAALGLATGLSTLAGPLLSTRIGKVRAIALAQALSIPFLLTLGFAPALAVAVGAAMLRAALFNLGSPLYDAFAMERSDEAARPTVIGLINAAYASGYLVAPPISVLVQERLGFGPLFIATAACYALAVLALLAFFGSQKQPGAGAGRRGERQALE